MDLYRKLIRKFIIKFSATSIKVIENDEKEIRDLWWIEMRDEIKSHAKALGCMWIVGYNYSSFILLKGTKKLQRFMMNFLF